METKRFDQLDALAGYVRTLGDGLLFRGQDKHYVLPNGAVQLMPSQIRKGCVPPTLAQVDVLRDGRIKSFHGRHDNLHRHRVSSGTSPTLRLAELLLGRHEKFADRSLVR